MGEFGNGLLYKSWRESGGAKIFRWHRTTPEIGGRLLKATSTIFFMNRLLPTGRSVPKLHGDPLGLIEIKLRRTGGTLGWRAAAHSEVGRDSRRFDPLPGKSVTGMYI